MDVRGGLLGEADRPRRVEGELEEGAGLDVRGPGEAEYQDWMSEDSGGLDSGGEEVLDEDVLPPTEDDLPASFDCPIFMTPISADEVDESTGMLVGDGGAVVGEDGNTYGKNAILEVLARAKAAGVAFRYPINRQLPAERNRPRLVPNRFYYSVKADVLAELKKKKELEGKLDKREKRAEEKLAKERRTR